MNFIEKASKKIRRAAEDFVHMTSDVVYDRVDGFWVRAYAVFLKALSYVFSGILPPKTIAHAKINKKLHLNVMLNEKALLFVESTGKYSFYTFRLFVFSAILCNFTYA